jgi:hypothetical protein
MYAVYAKEGARQYRFRAGRWESRRLKADGSGLENWWGYSEWLHHNTEAQGIVKLERCGWRAEEEINA